MPTSNSTHVGVLVETSSAHGRGLIRGIAEYAHRHTNWSLRVEETGPLRAAPQWLGDWRGSGLIARLETPSLTRAVLALGIPVVNVSGTGVTDISRVDTDNRAVCELAAEYFLQRRYRHYAYCGIPRFEWSGWRQEFFGECLGKARVTYSAYRLHDTAQSEEALRTWLKALPKPVALLACNDLCACHILEACERSGIVVPDEIAVLGVDDDTILCTLCRPRLSSVAPDTEGIGYLAGETLHRLLRGEKAQPISLVRPLSVHARQSTDATAIPQWHVGQALRFIHGNATRDISVEDVVLQARTSRRFLEKQFLAVVGRAIHAEIFRMRMETAQRLLAATTLPLKDVAVRSGFRRADYLSSVFHQKLGLSPSQYRGRSQQMVSQSQANNAC